MLRTLRVLAHASLLVGMLGCASTGSRDSAPTPGELYSLAKQSYLSANYVGAVSASSQYLRQAPQGSSALEARRIRAQASLYLQQYEQARKDFTVIYEKAGGPHPKAYAALGLGHTEFGRGQYAKAVAQYRKALEEEQRDGNSCLHSVRDEVHFGMGVCLQNIGHWKEAEDHLYKVWRKFPQSKWRRDAERRVFCNSFSVQIGAYSQYGRAHKQLETAQGRGLEARIEVRRRNGKQMFAVLIGSLPDLSKASTAKQRVARKLGLSEQSLAISTAQRRPH